MCMFTVCSLTVHVHVFTYLGRILCIATLELVNGAVLFIAHAVPGTFEIRSTRLVHSTHTIDVGVR